MKTISLEDALSIMDDLQSEDISKYGEETAFTFDAERAKKALASLRIFDEPIKTRCANCIFKYDEVIEDKTRKGGIVIIKQCEKLDGRYLGDLGYCSEGKEQRCK